MDPGHSIPTRHVSEFLFGVIRTEGDIDVSGVPLKFSFLDKAVLLQQGDSELQKDFKAPVFGHFPCFCQMGNWSPSEVPRNYWVGNKNVAEEMSMFRYSIFSFVKDGEELFALLCRALGIEFVGSDGQGRLGIPDPNPNAPDPPPSSTD